MSGSYRQCSDCGKRALRIATRCPGCGRELPPLASAPGSGTGRLPSVQSVLGVLALGAVLLAGWEARRRGAVSSDESSYVAATDRAEPGDVATPLDSAPFAATPRLDTVAPDLARSAASSAHRPGADPVTPTGGAGVSPRVVSDTGRLLVARTWTNVRNRRSVKGGLEAVLMPGATVLADSLSRGWYRVALEGEVMGYASASTLFSGPADSPQ